ncbi:J domain-containing protein [Haloarcula salinisoli]|uniref:DnaJ domain-containing protein n=1 Tax=Haloarcula salinisoli TaxID=2487746 RepID=A0A8J7YBV8_9EURY|nr:DnaJ domain-containing protein [Halomicroarcula salinisoli]MBX0285326.1 DnaJ domain-containing protein [Halomicroarcula salinisoli]MBX0303195.1 DnaJ domain-containing protein [Halomicroarcula salinisoli]
MTESFYDVLGVAEDATTDEIESAYRERLKETHPDVSDDDDAGQATKTLIEARDVLVDEDERARYDRLGHEAYVGDGAAAARDAATETSGRDTDSDARSSDTGTSGGTSQSRARREQRASERVSQERRKARDARQRRRETAQEGRTGTDDADTASASASTSTTRSTSDYETTPTGGRRTAATDTTSATASGSTYSVRENVSTSTSHGPLLPQGRQLTLLGLFFALYPVLLFSALLPAFPPFVNVILSACTLLTIMYLQSMPRVAVLLFGGWSAISIVGLGLFGVGYVSPVGLVVLLGTVLPFGFSVLTAAALRY